MLELHCAVPGATGALVWMTTHLSVRQYGSLLKYSGAGCVVAGPPWREQDRAAVAALARPVWIILCGEGRA